MPWCNGQWDPGPAGHEPPQQAQSAWEVGGHNALQAPEHAAKDQGNSPCNCFRKPGSKNFQNIFPPSATLYLCNIPPSISEDDQKTLFYSYGRAVKGFRFFHRVCWMTPIQMGSLEEAIQEFIDQSRREPPPAGVLLPVHHLGPTTKDRPAGRSW